jgi:SNF family Na+-dependent transporter
MLVPILNLLFPLLFLAGIGSLITGIITYVIAIKKKSLQLQKKAIIIIIAGGGIMISCLVAVNLFKNWFN